MENGKSVIQRINNCANDKERWEIILSNQSVVEIQLDNDETYIMSKEDSNDYTTLKNSIGNSSGIFPLLEQLEVECDLV